MHYSAPFTSRLLCTTTLHPSHRTELGLLAGRAFRGWSALLIGWPWGGMSCEHVKQKENCHWYMHMHGRDVFDIGRKETHKISEKLIFLVFFFALFRPNRELARRKSCGVEGRRDERKFIVALFRFTCATSHCTSKYSGTSG
jgi:hypothetical protein